MALNIANLNVRGLRDSSKCACLLGELKNLCVDVAAVQETHFTCDADCRVLENDFNVFSAYGSHVSDGVSLLVGRSLDADVDVVFAGDGGRLFVADVAGQQLNLDKAKEAKSIDNRLSRAAARGGLPRCRTS